ncbi:hypothetical protein ACIP2X_08130 [Streptomyces sp. NPDC089424]|uniref:hypothetical protein n=1 Tax=Streptomyces sp. NPDC089424 TaxID=3365917 RepID=UPI00380B06C7
MLRQLRLIDGWITAEERREKERRQGAHHCQPPGVTGVQLLTNPMTHLIGSTT